MSKTHNTKTIRGSNNRQLTWFSIYLLLPFFLAPTQQLQRYSTVAVIPWMPSVTAPCLATKYNSGSNYPGPPVNQAVLPSTTRRVLPWISQTPKAAWPAKIKLSVLVQRVVLQPLKLAAEPVLLLT